MSIPISIADGPTGLPRAAGEEAPPQGRWRTGGLPALRAELDRIDNAVHDLLMQRAEIVEYVARSKKPAAFRPGREASIIRRLLARHQGGLPAASLVRIWRELLAGTTAMQGGFSVAAYDADQRTGLTQLAREHFGALTPVQVRGSVRQLLEDVDQGTTSVAVLPYPADSENWWVTLLHHKPRLHIICRLPFWQPRPDGIPSTQALVVAATPADASGDDQSFLGLECDCDVSRVQLKNELSAAGLNPQSMLLAPQQATSIANLLVEVAGYLSDDDPRLKKLGTLLRRPIVLGSYAVPVAGCAQ